MGKLKILTVILGALLVGAVLSVGIKEYVIPQQATVEPTVNLDIYIDGTPWTNGTLLDWENVTAGETYCFQNLTVVNIGNVNVTVYLLAPDLPAGWTQTWTANATFLQPTEKVEADLTLTVDASAACQTYSWNSYIRGEQT